MANSLLAAIFSFFIPGLGQFYCGSFLKGLLVFIGSFVVGFIAIIVPVIGWLIALLYWIWNICDAYSSAK
ncbi:hypothetical protein MmiHf6_08520 [Methanimicrococcus hongohii]|uniref:TM2 domain-containing protein n=1 Tax=Methanimicrococcus hongohii TaxID=3028295 RepID=A0AA97A1U3_9EURY|nr:hypothetical protein [Methanimicrococcus sp. Hf6]WNY23543.1 hypothetical protein MmiHf6_08520 [Methanimicrococcus sp. Hf6]